MIFPTPPDYAAAVQQPAVVFRDPELRNSRVLMNPKFPGTPAGTGGNFAQIFYLHGSGHQEWVVRCFLQDAPGRSARYAEICHFLRECSEPFLTKAEYFEEGILHSGQFYPIVKMPRVSGTTIDQFIESILGKRSALEQLSNDFCHIVTRLNQLGVAHGDLQHGNIIADTNGRLVLVDYDGMYLPSLARSPSGEKGHANYQHPLRNTDYNKDLDRFSSIVIYLAIKALSLDPTLWSKYCYSTNKGDGSDNLLFRKSDFHGPFSSRLLADLEKLPELDREIGMFRSICAMTLADTPQLADFIALGGKTAKPPATSWVNSYPSATVNQRTASSGGQPSTPRVTPEIFGEIYGPWAKAAIAAETSQSPPPNTRHYPKPTARNSSTIENRRRLGFPIWFLILLIAGGIFWLSVTSMDATLMQVIGRVQSQLVSRFSPTPQIGNASVSPEASDGTQPSKLGVEAMTWTKAYLYSSPKRLGDYFIGILPAHLPLTVIGRDRDNRWLYVQIGEEKKGWLEVAAISGTIDLSGIPERSE